MTSTLIFFKNTLAYFVTIVLEANNVDEIDTRRSVELSWQVSVGAEVPDEDAGQWEDLDAVVRAICDLHLELKVCLH